ncbi:MAG: carbohydrate-binding domain-containing protein [Lachnospiraceae bacterium]|nr:carbohydrate-binding domain-containing protein [Lachnospiraceae bacterium]
MISRKNINLICIGITIFTVLLTTLFMNGEAMGMEKIVDEDAESQEGNTYFTANDLAGDWDASDATQITLKGDTGSISGGGAYFYDGDLIIAQAGWYVLSGELTEGQILVSAESGSKVWILLNGVTVNCSDGACFVVEQADKVFLTLAQGSENSFTSGSSYSEEAQENGCDGAIYAKDDLTINGSGHLTIEAGYKHGIEANDDFVMTGGSVTITAAQDGITANDSIRIGGGELTISASDDGIHCDGTFYMAEGTVLITDCYEGIEALNITVEGGSISVYPTDDGFNANGGSTDGFGFGMRGGFGGGWQQAGSSDAESAETGTAGAETTAAGTTGKETTTAEDTQEESFIRISGGDILIVNPTGRDADGLDSNGSIYITGGNIRISLNGDSSNCAIDYGSESGGVCEISGGTVVACGGSSMAEAFDTSSAQAAILYGLSGTADAGTQITLTDADGKELLSYEAACTFTSVNISCPEMEVGETYLLTIGDETAEITQESVSVTGGSLQGMSGGMMGGMQGGFGGGQGGGQGGMQGGRGFGGERPEGGEMPEFDGEMPEFDGEMPEFDGEMPEFGAQDSDAAESGADTRMQGGQMPQGQPGGEAGTTGTTADAAADAAADTAADGTTGYWMIALSCGGLLCGLAFVILYKRKEF